MQPPAAPRHDRVGIAGEREQVLGEWRGHVRHVARDDQHRITARVAQRRVNAAERSAAGHDVGDRSDRCPTGRTLGLCLGRGASGIAALEVTIVPPTADNHHSSTRPERRELTLENRHAVDDERALVAPAETGRLTAGEDGYASVDHNQPILT